MKVSHALLLIFLSTLISCKQKNKSKEIASYEYSSQVVLNAKLQERLGDWVEENQTCYGLVISSFSNQKIALAKPVKAKVITITADAIKMKALETVNVGVSEKAKACGKLQIEKGQTWWEEDGDLFKTLEEAQTYANKLNSKAATHKFTID